MVAVLGDSEAERIAQVFAGFEEDLFLGNEFAAEFEAKVGLPLFESLSTPVDRNRDVIIDEQRFRCAEFLELELSGIRAADAVDVQRNLALDTLQGYLLQREPAGVVLSVCDNHDRAGQIAFLRF